MDLLTYVIAILTLAAGVIAAWYTYLSYKRSAEKKKSLQLLSDESNTPIFEHNESSAVQQLDSKLITYFWQYPIAGNSQASWAVKESAVLRGKLQYAREQPGLGIAILSTELATNLYGKNTEERIEDCVSWALSRCQKNPPHLIIAEIIDPVTSEIVRKPDFRHTLAFAVILARTRKLLIYLEQYLELTLQSQNPDGGWPAGEGVTVSELFTVIYACELLSLCSSDARLPISTQEECLVHLDKAIQWLVSVAESSGLWVSGVLKEFSWDNLISTAWVIHRLPPIQGVRVQNWQLCLSRAAGTMIGYAMDLNTWAGTKKLQRFRVEARIAAAIAVLLRTGSTQKHNDERLQLYLSDWRRRGTNWIASTGENEWDLATVIFMLYALHSKSKLRELAVRAGISSTTNKRESI